jgi:hypothetical protein
MKKSSTDMFAFYTENKYGLFDELIVFMFDRQFEFNGNLDERELLFKNYNKVLEWRISQNMFSALLEIYERYYCGKHYVNDESYEMRQQENKKYMAEERKRPKIYKKEIWQAINWQVEKERLSSIISFDYNYEKDNYYDFNLIIEKIHAFIRGEKSVSYFTAWCVLVMRCLEDGMACNNKKLKKLYSCISDYFDCIAFMSPNITEAEKLKECRELIAELKYHNHLIEDIKHHRETDFETNGVITYVNFAFSANDGNDVLYNVCVIDNDKKTINYLITANLEYDERINYTILSVGEFEELSLKYYCGYVIDRSMKADYAATKSIPSKS